MTYQNMRYDSKLHLSCRRLRSLTVYSRYSINIVKQKVLGQLVMQVVIPFLNRGAATLLTVLRYTLMAGLYVGVVAVIWSVVVRDEGNHLKF
jgi:hypothetical protein